MNTLQEKQARLATFYDSKQVKFLFEKVFKSDFFHVGMYDAKHQSIDDASRATTERMLNLLPKINKSTRILEIGSGRGATARVIVEKYGCKIDCVDLAADANIFSNKANEKLEYDQVIKIHEGAVQDLIFDNETYDFVWAQEALLHSFDKETLFRQVTRMLKPEGRFIFTDLLVQIDCDDDDWLEKQEDQAFLELSTLANYKRLARVNNLYTAYIKEMPKQLATHLEALSTAIDNHKKEVKKQLSDKEFDLLHDLLANLKRGSDQGCLSWGLLIFQKINT